MKYVLTLVVLLGFFALGWYAHTIYSFKSTTSELNEVKRLNLVIDSIKSNRDTLIIKEYETKIKWKVRNIRDSFYIVNAVDSLQPIIRANLRKRYNNLRDY